MTRPSILADTVATLPIVACGGRREHHGARQVRSGEHHRSHQQNHVDQDIDYPQSPKLP